MFVCLRVFHVLITFSRYDFSFDQVVCVHLTFYWLFVRFVSGFCLRFSCSWWNFSAIVAAAAAAAGGGCGGGYWCWWLLLLLVVVVVVVL